jgi:hypothetical protein
VARRFLQRKYLSSIGPPQSLATAAPTGFHAARTVFARFQQLAFRQRLADQLAAAAEMQEA